MPVRSEREFMWSMFKDLVLTPYNLVMYISGKRTIHAVMEPLYNYLRYLVEPRFTMGMNVALLLSFVWSLTAHPRSVEPLLLYPQHLFEGKVLGLLTSGFLHADGSHLLGNILALTLFGRVVERQLGSLKTATIYFGALLISGFFTSIIHAKILGDNIAGLGASGAIMGIVAAAILLDPLYFTYDFVIPIPIMLLGWFAILADITGVINPVETGIGHIAHLGGFFSIGLIMYLLSPDDQQRLRLGLLTNVVSITLIAVVYFFFLV